MNNLQINLQCKNILENLKNHGYLNKIKELNKEIKQFPNPFDKNFYLVKQDELNEVYGELVVAYYNIKGLVEKYMSKRMLELFVEQQQTGKITVNNIAIEQKRVPGKDLLERMILTEINEANEILTILKGYIDITLQSIRTTRNHIYSKIGSEFEKEELGENNL